MRRIFNIRLTGHTGLKYLFYDLIQLFICLLEFLILLLQLVTSGLAII